MASSIDYMESVKTSYAYTWSIISYFKCFLNTRFIKKSISAFFFFFYSYSSYLFNLASSSSNYLFFSMLIESFDNGHIGDIVLSKSFSTFFNLSFNSFFHFLILIYSLNLISSLVVIPSWICLVIFCLFYYFLFFTYCSSVLLIRPFFNNWAYLDHYSCL